MGDGAVSYIPFSFLSLLLSSLHHRPLPYPRSTEEKALNQTADASLRLLPWLLFSLSSSATGCDLSLTTASCWIGKVVQWWGPAEREGHSVVHILGYIQPLSVFNAAIWCDILTRTHGLACVALRLKLKKNISVCVCVNVHLPVKALMTPGLIPEWGAWGHSPSPWQQLPLADSIRITVATLGLGGHWMGPLNMPLPHFIHTHTRARTHAHTLFVRLLIG